MEKVSAMKTWEKFEDDVLIANISTVKGLKWKHIEKKLEHRSIASIRNRFQRLSQGSSSSERHRKRTRINICSLCKKPKRGHLCTARPLKPSSIVQEIQGMFELLPMQRENETTVDGSETKERCLKGLFSIRTEKTGEDESISQTMKMLSELQSAFTGEDERMKRSFPGEDEQPPTLLAYIKDICQECETGST